LNDISRNEENRVLPIYLVVGIFSHFLLLSGLLRDDLFLRIAVYGPVIISGLGLLIFMLIIDFRHGVSTSIESQIQSRIPKLTDTEVKLFFVISLIFLTINLFWLARIMLSSNLPYAFALFFLSGSALLGIFVGRGMVAFTSFFQVERPLSSLLGKQTPKEQKEEALFLISCLSSNVQHKIPSQRQKDIRTQRQRFHEFCAYLDSDSFDNWIIPLTKAVASPQLFEVALLKSLDKATSDWVRIARRLCSDDSERNVLNATLLLDCTSFLLYKVTPLATVSDEFFKQLLSLTGIYLKAVQGQVEGLLEGTSEVIGTTKVHSERLPFLRSVARKEIEFDEHNWDPIQIVTLLYRTTETFRLVEEMDVEDQEKIELKNTFKRPILDSFFGSILYFLREHDRNMELQNQTGFRDNYFSEIKNWPNLRRFNKKQFKEIYKKLLESIPSGNFSLVQQLILLAWNLNQAISTKEE
jgi:hypothetical protein